MSRIRVVQGIGSGQHKNAGYRSEQLSRARRPDSFKSRYKDIKDFRTNGQFSFTGLANVMTNP